MPLGVGVEPARQAGECSSGPLGGLGTQVCESSGLLLRQWWGALGALQVCTEISEAHKHWRCVECAGNTGNRDVFSGAGLPGLNPSFTAYYTWDLGRVTQPPAPPHSRLQNVNLMGHENGRT